MRPGNEVRSLRTGETRSGDDPRHKRRPGQPRIEGGSREARLRAAVILDVLAGVCTPADAARAVGVSLQRYYALESRLLESLVVACENRSRGQRIGPEKKLAELEREVDRLTRECARRQALVRALQRTVGISLPEKPAPGKRKRGRRPTVRALKAAAVLRTAAEPAASPAP